MIGWRDGEEQLHRGSLFAVFAALSRGESWSFPVLRPHQREPWHAFTAQVAALALIRAGIDEPPTDETAWRDLLLALTPGQPEAWELVVDDWSKPALLQPAVVEAANRGDYRNHLPTPDALDMLVTAKNHDVKQERIAEASDEDWLFALVTLQTTEGFLGAGNYGISRMNGGFASRMSLGVRPATGGAAGAFRRDVRRLVADARARPERRHGLALLWTRPWDGTQSLDFTRLDELYVDICRRVRLVRTPNGVEAHAAGSKCARVAAAELKGKTADPWAPLKADGSASVTPTGSGFGYRTMTRLLQGTETTLPLLAKLHSEDDREGLSITAAALVRGQGKTEGLHRRAIRTSRIQEIDAYGPAEPLDRIGDIARTRSDEAGEARQRLRRALILLVQGGPDQARLDDDSAGKKVEPWVRSFEQRVDREFFGDPLWNEAAGDDANHRETWRKRLRELAREVFAEAAEAAPRTEMRRIRAIARARTMLDAQMAKWLKEVA
jgi:CRISPR system Cascade subunit CasA